MEINKLALPGKVGSFIINFKPSAKGCNNLNKVMTTARCQGDNWE